MKAFTKEGYDVAVINYQAGTEEYFSKLCQMTKPQALNYLHQNQVKLEISTEKNIVLMGHSAGAFNVMSAVVSSKAKYNSMFR